MPVAADLLAATPPMGWNSWNRFAGSVSETLVKQTADAMVSSGMKDAGYVYVNVDDTWQASRDAAGNIQADATRFPGGMKDLADYVHALGLKFGLYSDRGTATCAGRPGSYGYEDQDAAAYAEWGVDYVKYDNCNPAEGRDNDLAMREDHTRMGEALRATGRPIVFSICAWWFYGWEPPVGQLWRTTTDITDTWDVDNHSVISLINKNGGDTARYGTFSEANPRSAAYPAPGLAQYAGPGHWNDPDMLEVGNGGMTDAEYRSHFSMWAIMAAPLIAGNDIANMTQATKDILLNAEIIAVDQDPLGIQGRPISESTTLEVWSKRLAGERSHAVVLFNRTEAPADITVTWQSLGLTGTTAAVRDLWAHADLGNIEAQYTANVPSHGVVVLRVVGAP
jgi:alpha-galactosidase